MADLDSPETPVPAPPEGAGAGRARARDASTDEGGTATRRAGDAAAVRRARKQVLLRLDPDVHSAVAKWAADDLRSVNAQIEVLLRRALKDAGRDPHAAPMRGRGRPRSDG